MKTFSRAWKDCPTFPHDSRLNPWGRRQFQSLRPGNPTSKTRTPPFGLLHRHKSRQSFSSKSIEPMIFFSTF